MDKAEFTIAKTIAALEDVLQVSIRIQISSCLIWLFFFLSKDTTDSRRTIDTRLCAFENIFRLLDTATQLGIGPKLNELAVNGEADPVATSIDGSRLPSASQQLGSLKKVKTKSVAIQTNISNRVRSIVLIVNNHEVHICLSRILFHITFKLI